MKIDFKPVLGKLGVILSACMALGLVACSGFERAWERAGAPIGALAHKPPFAGRWSGEWRSAQRPGSGDRLRCVLVHVEGNRYQGRFWARWHGLSSTYLVDLQTHSRGDELVFSGEQKLPAIFGGVYRYTGTVTPTRLRANYDSSYDRGTFELEREEKAEGGKLKAKTLSR